ncbi:695_t:CDS:10 [Acaulospora morrowiae]|uniref:695_t:CDS:1 n=1 Tax=Acaulospora morrowiae TaxID=94023 RepID=A0A9N8VSA4_9GLOM|nr:695_t:CDS:10 [Acaulospora morrowiae]
MQTEDFIPIIQDDSNVEESVASSQHGNVTTLFVRKIPYDATDSEFESFFSEIGPIRSCFLVKETNSSIKPSDPEGSNPAPPKDKEEREVRNRGYGFVRYALSQDAEHALKELKKVKFRGTHTLKMEIALKKHEKPSFVEADKKSGHLSASEKKKINNELSNKPERASKTILIQGLPKDLTRKRIYKKVRKFGDVEDMIYSEEGHEIAHITFKTVKDATNALRHLDGHMFHGSRMNAKFVDGEANKSNSVDKKSRLIVRNIPWEYREQDLLKIFSACGEVVEVSLPRKYKGGPLRGFACIQYRKREEAEKAISDLNETKHHGRTIAVDWSLPKDKYLEAMGAFQAKLTGDPGNGPGGTHEDQIKDEDIRNVDSEDDKSVEETGEREDDEIMTDAKDDVNSENHRSTGTIKREAHPPSEGNVLFIRNLAFEATEEELGAIFRPFGPLRYHVITRDSATGRSRGTGFVCFVHKEHADECLSEAKKIHHIAVDSNELSSKKGKRKELVYKSILTADPSDLQALKFTLRGRVLSVVKAVDKDEAHKLMEINQDKRRKEDRRNLYLMNEGGTPVAESLPTSEMNKRITSFNTRKNLLAKNPNLYISKTRLSIRNIPLTVDESRLKNLGKESIQNFKEEVRKGEREDLRKSEKIEGWDKLIKIKQAKIARSKDRVDSVTQKLRSKGYGFLEYVEHAHALAALRYLNNNPKVFGEKKRPIVEFAIENSIIVKRRAERLKGIKGGRSDKSNRNIDNKEKSGDTPDRKFNNNNENINSKRKRETNNDAQSSTKKKAKVIHRKSPKVLKRRK